MTFVMLILQPIQVLVYNLHCSEWRITVVRMNQEASSNTTVSRRRARHSAEGSCISLTNSASRPNIALDWVLVDSLWNWIAVVVVYAPAPPSGCTFYAGAASIATCFTCIKFRDTAAWSLADDERSTCWGLCCGLWCHWCRCGLCCRLWCNRRWCGLCVGFAVTGADVGLIKL